MIYAMQLKLMSSSIYIRPCERNGWFVLVRMARYAVSGRYNNIMCGIYGVALSKAKFICCGG